MWLPFFCLIIGIVAAKKLRHLADPAIRVGLYILLLGMGIKVGGDQQLLAAIPRLGFKAALFCFFSSLLSILLVVLWEKFFLNGQQSEKVKVSISSFRREFTFAGVVFMFLLMGLVIGRWMLFFPYKYSGIVIDLALVIIFIGIGVTMRYTVRELMEEPRSYMVYMPLPILVTIGSLAGGIAAGIICGEGLRCSAAIGGGMAYYSLTTALITDQAGITVGLIAFLANFLRELITFILAPILARFSRTAPIALGGATTMDTTLAVIKQSLDEEYTLVAFFNGVALSIIVPLLLFVLLGV